ncbi:MAG: hypothetical protein Q7U08_00960 [Flavobacteriaceae bacterium]|nr:hypothetical protein [Flavobacteriaceae bacterium]
MKNLSNFSFVAIIFVLFAACQVNDSMDDTLGVDVQKYENLLTQDFTNASQFNLGYKTQQSIQESNKTSVINPLYNHLMFRKHDSLFSRHFYEFSMDMMKNQGMMNGSSGMMGNTGGMMNSGYMMGSSDDMKYMIKYMDSLHFSTQKMLVPNFIKHDSLMFSQMKIRKMMISQTIGIQNVYEKMQQLRKNHK